MEERRFPAMELGFMTDRVTEQSNEQKTGFYLVLEADDEHLSPDALPARTPDSCP
jgi:hypothetical protein